MRTRLRFGAASAVALGALLLATVLASPALAWHSTVKVTSRCFEGHVRVVYNVKAWEPDHEATVAVAYEHGNVVKPIESKSHFFAPGHDEFFGHFDLPAGTTGKITVIAVATWKEGELSTNKGSDMLPPADECDDTSPSTSTVPPTTVTPTTVPGTTVTPTTVPEPTVAPSSSPPTTDDTEVGAVTSTIGGGALPFTGASSGPMLLAGIALVGGGALVLLLSRAKGGQTAR